MVHSNPDCTSKRSRLLMRGMLSSSRSIAGTSLSIRFLSTLARSVLSEPADKASRSCSIFFASGPLYEFQIRYRPSNKSTTAMKAIIVKMGKNPPVSKFCMFASLLFVALGRVEHRIRQVDAVIAEPVREFWPDTGCLEVSGYVPTGIDTRLPVSKDFLHGYDLAFHAGDLLDGCNLAPAIGQPVSLYDDRICRCDLLPRYLVR